MATKTLNIALDEQLIKEIDKAVKSDFASRSEYFRRLALADLDRRERWSELINSGREVGREMGIVNEDQLDMLLNG